MELKIENKVNGIVSVKCSDGHIFEVSSKIFKREYGCPKCKLKNRIEKINRQTGNFLLLANNNEKQIINCNKY